MNTKVRLFLICFSILLSACEFTPFAPLPPDLGPAVSAIPVPINLYVAPAGDDANSCTSVSNPCQTLQGAADKADDGDTINMAAGTYPTMDTAIANWAEIHKQVTIVGAGMDTTFLNIGTYYGLLIVGADDVVIRDLTIRNRSTEWASTGIGFDDAAGNASIENVRVQGFPSRAVRHDGTAQLSLTNVIIEGSSFAGASGVQAQNCAIHDSEIRDNNNAGLLCSTLVMEDSVVENNGWFGLIPYPDVPTSSISIRDSRFLHNGYAAMSISGGATTLTRVTINANGLGGLGSGLERSGVLMSNRASLELINSALTANYRGIIMRGGWLVVRSSQLSGNLNAAIDGAWAESTISVIDSEVADNNATPDSRFPDLAAIVANGSLTIRGSTINGNSGGAINHVNYSGSGATIIETSIEGTVNPSRNAAVSLAGQTLIERSLIANNEATGIWSYGPLTLVNSTISGNTLGGILVRGADVTLRFSTIAENGGIGFLWYSSFDAATVESSLMTANGGRDCDADTAARHATWTSTSGVNIDSDGSCGFEETYAPALLHLGPLADNTGPTWTHALQVGSPAIDAIPEGCISEDQRNLFRPYNDACDVGAYEYHFALSTLVVVPLSDTNCRLGNSTAFDIADTLFAGVEYSPIARGTDNLWLQFEGPATGQKCWAYAEGMADVDGNPVNLTDIPTDALPIAAYPLPPQEDEEPEEGDSEGGTPPNAPANAYIKQTCTGQEYKVQLVWIDASDNEEGFRIYRDGNLIATKGAGKQEHNDFPAYGGPYVYIIEAFNAHGAASTKVQDAGCLP